MQDLEKESGVWNPVATFRFSYAGFHATRVLGFGLLLLTLSSQIQIRGNNTNQKQTHSPTATMMIIPSLNLNLFNSTKVDLAPAPAEEQTEAPTLGNVEKSRVRLGMEQKLFSRAGDAFPIITALTGSPYLQAKSNGKDIVVFGDAAGEPLVAIERVGNTFKIFSTQGQTPLAEVTQNGKVLNVVMEGQSDPTYTIHKVVQHASHRFPTKHIIKNNGKPVASTRYGQGNSYMLTVNADTDSSLMTCLAAIADEIHA